MNQPQRSIFRERAVHQHIYKRDQDILPHFVSPLALGVLWAFLLLVFLVALLAWVAEIPDYRSVVGILPTAPSTNQASTTGQVVLFISTPLAAQFHQGMPVQFPGNTAGSTCTGQLTQIQPGQHSLTEVRQRFAIDEKTAQLLPQSSVIATVTLNKNAACQHKTGQTINAQVQVGTYEALSLLSL